MGRDPFNAVVEAAADVAVMHHESVGEAGEFRPRLVISDDLRLAREIAGGHHQRGPEAVEQQVMERRVGQHPAERRLPGGKEVGQGRPVFLQKNDGGGGTL
jgi:hypothetical protein